MAFAIRDLSVLAYANGFTLWHYKARADDLAAVGGQEFFRGAADVMKLGDLVMVSAADGAKIVSIAGADAVLNIGPLG